MVGVAFDVAVDVYGYGLMAVVECTAKPAARVTRGADGLTPCTRLTV